MAGLTLARTPTTLSIKMRKGSNKHQHFDIYNGTNSNELTFTLTSNKAWCTPTAAVYTCTNVHRECTATYDTNKMQLGTHTATITAASAGATSVTVVVTAVVSADQGTHTHPGGDNGDGVKSIKKIEGMYKLPLSGGRKRK